MMSGFRKHFLRFDLQVRTPSESTRLRVRDALERECLLVATRTFYSSQQVDVCSRALLVSFIFDPNRRDTLTIIEVQRRRASDEVRERSPFPWKLHLERSAELPWLLDDVQYFFEWAASSPKRTASRQAVDRKWAAALDGLAAVADTEWKRHVVQHTALLKPESVDDVDRWNARARASLGWPPPGTLLRSKRGARAILRIERYELTNGSVVVSGRDGREHRWHWHDLSGFCVPMAPDELTDEERAGLLVEPDPSRSTPELSEDGRIQRLPHWRLLPRPPRDPLQFREYLRTHGVGASHSAEDLERLELVMSLGPEQVALGEAEFLGYFAFIFDDSTLTVLENTLVGNAIYVLDSNWQALSQRRKSELLNDGWQRIVHKGDWFERLSLEVRTRRGRK